MIEQHVRFPSGQETAGGLLAHPGGEGPFAAVLLTPAIAGINDYVASVAERLADQGYVCLALDYFTREGGPPDLSGMEKILAAVANLPDPRVLRDMEAALAYLEARADVAHDRVGLVGFCLGGSYSVLAASRFDGPRCAVSFYGMLRYPEINERKPLAPIDAAADLRCPYLGHFGEEDHLVPVDDALTLRKRVSGKPAEIYTYPGAGHAFHEDFRPSVYRPVAAHEAWARTITFLDWHLKTAVDHG